MSSGSGATAGEPADAPPNHRCSPTVLRISMHVYEVHPRKDKRGVDLISDVLPFGREW